MASCGKRRGFTLVWLAISMVMLMGMASLAVDYSRVQVVKTQLRRAADAAARYGSMGLPSGNAVAWAQAVAADNSVNGSAFSLQAGDIQTGNWSSGTFTAGGTPLNAIQITAQLSAARGNAVPLLFGQAVGMRTCNVTSTTTATAQFSSSYGFAGLSKLEIKDVTTMDSYDSSIGYPASAGNQGTIASNLAIKIDSAGTIHGNVATPAGASVDTGGSLLYGSVITLPSALSYPAASAGSAATTNNNSSVPGGNLSSGNFSLASGSLSLPGGTYYFGNMTVAAGTTLTFTGPATIYVTGALTMYGTLNTYNNKPTNMRFKVVGAGGVDIQGAGVLYADVYAPQSKAGLKNDQGFFGAIVTDQIKFQGTSGFHFDTALGYGSVTSGSITFAN